MVKSLGDVLGSGKSTIPKKEFSEHVDNQMKIGGDFSVVKVQGFIRNLVITPREGKDNMYKFQLKFIDENDLLQEPNDWYSGFKDFPGQDEDYIIFNYKVNGQWNNVKEILDIRHTHKNPDEKDAKNLKDVNKEMIEPKLASNLEGSDARVQLPTDGLSEPYKALLLNGTIHLCTKRGTLTHDEIVAQYCRFLNLINE